MGPHLGAWSDLHGRRFDNHPLLSASFVEGLLRHFADGTEHLFVLEVGGVAQAMGVLQRRSRWQWTTFRPAQAQIGCLLIAQGESLSGLVECLPETVAMLDLMCLDPQLSGHFATQALAFRRHHARTMKVVVRGTYGAYLADRPGGLRTNLRRYAKKIAADGLSIRYEAIHDSPEIAAAVMRYAQLESRGWKGALGTALSPSGAQTRFYVDLLESAARRGESSVHELWIGSTLAASRLILGGGRMTVTLKTTYDEGLAKYAPGRLLLAEVLRIMHDRGEGHAVEFYTDASADQLSWATDSRCIYDLRLYRRGFAGAAAHAMVNLRQLRRRPPAGDEAESVQVDCLEHFGEAPSDVAALFDDRVPACGLQASIGWFAMLQRHCFSGRDSALFVLRHRGVPVAALPLCHDGVRADAMANYYTANFEPPIAPWLKAPHLQPLLRAVRTHWPQVASIALWPMDQVSHSYMLYQEAFELEGLMTMHSARHANWIWPRPGGSGWEQYLAARSGAVRSTVLRASRRFEARGGRIEVITGGDRLDAGIAAYELVYAASWKRSERYPGFVRDLMRMAVARSGLRLGIAWLGETPIAVQLWIVIDGRAEIFKLAYDERFKALSPGTLVTSHLMRRAIEDDGVRIVDYLSGDDRYKADWMTERSLRWDLVAHDPRRLRGCKAILRSLAGIGLRALGRWAPLTRLVRS